MNKLNKIFFIFAFISIFFVFTSVSYAIEPNTNYKNNSYNTNYNGTSPSGVRDILNNYKTDPTNLSYKSAIDDYLATLTNPYVFYYSESGLYGAQYCIAEAFNGGELTVTQIGDNYYLGGVIEPAPSSNTECICFYWSGSTTSYEAYSGPTIRNGYSTVLPIASIISSTVDLPLFVNYSGNSLWDGESYFYKSDTGSDTPTLPTNKEISDAVQKFYNSDIYKNNTNFKDFMVIYSSLKNTYAFIGTDNHMLQEIFYDGVEVPGVNFSSSETWWRFNSKFGDIQSFLFGSTFYLYFLEGDSDVITNEGTGTLYDLFRSKYSMNMTIVYSTYDYDVIEYRPPAEGETENQVTQGTVEGDSYTYDENLDPTDSQYSPLQNFVGSNPTQSILNDVDFDSINQAFEDSKGILNIQGASWIFTANNHLVEYFIGFITFLIILLVISRIMGG